MYCTEILDESKCFFPIGAEIRNAKIPFTLI
jgi:hypothetical protein